MSLRSESGQALQGGTEACLAPRAPSPERGGAVLRSAATARVLPFAVFILFIALDPVLVPAGAAMGLDPLWWYGIRSGVTLGLLAWFWRSYEELALAPRVGAGAWTLAAGVGLAVFVLWINLDFYPISLQHSPGYDARRAGGEIRWGFALLRLAGSMLVVPVMEELFWRSFVMRWSQARDFLRVDPRQVGAYALGVSSVIFALEHHQWLAALLAGLAYGWLYRRTANLWTAVVAHAVTNGLLGCWVLYTGRWGFW